MKANTPTLFLLAVMAFAPLFTLPANAKIIYKDIDPDITRASTGITKIDVDDDGINELEIDFNIIGLKEVELTINTLGETKIAMMDLHPQLFKLYDSINNSCGWKTDQNLPLAFLRSGTPEGPWPGKENPYLGFSFVKDGKTLFGWMNIEVAENVRSYAIEEIAFEDIADFPIMAGDKIKSVSVNQNKTPETVPHFFITNRKLQVNLPVASMGAEVYIADLSGKILMRRSIVSGNENIDMNMLLPGLYCVSVLQNGRNTTRKLCLM